MMQHRDHEIDKKALSINRNLCTECVTLSGGNIATFVIALALLPIGSVIYTFGGLIDSALRDPNKTRAGLRIILVFMVAALAGVITYLALEYLVNSKSDMAKPIAKSLLAISVTAVTAGAMTFFSRQIGSQTGLLERARWEEVAPNEASSLLSKSTC